MLKTRALLLAAAVGAGTAVMAGPALAQNYVRLGHVTINRHGDHETQWNRFGGSMEGLRLAAVGNDIHCKSIRVQYGNGHWDRVYKGRLEEGHPVDVDLKGDQRKVRRVRFVCGTRGREAGRIYIEADIGRYSQEWNRSPAWARFLGAVMGGNRYAGNYGHNGYDHNGYDHGRYGYDHGRHGNDHGWTTIGYKRFDRRPDHERLKTHGWEGKNLRRIALKPHGDDARCSRIRVTFRNGHTRDLDVNTHHTMREGRMYTFDLPGHDRNIRRIDFKCRGVGHHHTRIQVLAD